MSKEIAILIPIGVIISSIVYLISCKRKGTGRMAWKIVQCVIAIVFGMFAYQIIVNLVDNNSAKALNACPASIQNISYGKAIESYCSDVTWSQFMDDNSKSTVIEMNGKGKYKNKEHDIKIQFMSADTTDTHGYLPDDAAIFVRFVGLDDDEETPEETEKDILFAMFSKYATEHDIELDESQKHDILETKAYQDQKGSDSTDASDESTDDTSDISSDDTGDSDSGSSLDDYDFDPCYAGVTNSDDEYAYLGVVDGEQAILVFYESDTNENICMAGDVTIDEDTGYCTLTDDETGVSLTFTVEEQDDGSYLLDLGDDGQIYLEQISSDDFVDCLKNLALYTDNVF